MNNRQIRCFLEAARLLNFTRAAENLILPQPAVSRYISALEEELGTELFLRKSSHCLALTEAGKAYYNFFQRMDLELKRTKQALTTSAPTLRLGINEGWRSTDFLPAVVALCREREPRFRVIYEAMDFRELSEGLHAKHFDAVISMEDYLLDSEEFAVEHITSLRRTIMYSDLLPDAAQLKSPEDFYPYDFLLTNDPLVRKLAEEDEFIFQTYHFVPRFRTVLNQETVVCCVENGDGVALLDEWCHARYHPHLHCVNTDEYIPVALARLRNEEISSVEMFRVCLTEYFRDRSGI